MSDRNDLAGQDGDKRSLKAALRRVRTAEAARSDAAVDIRDAERARLEVLADSLRGVFREVPADHDGFLFTIAGGSPARLWIDATAFVVMGRDRRTYRFLKDTRLGRTIIVETPEADIVADRVTDYVAERIIERERAIEGDWVAARARAGEDIGARPTPPMPPTPPPAPPEPPAPPPVIVQHERRSSSGWIAVAFLLGVAVGAAALFAYAWVKVPG